MPSHSIIRAYLSTLRGLKMGDGISDLHSVLAHPESVILVEETSLDAVRIKALGVAQCALTITEKDRATLAVTRFHSVERDWTKFDLPLRKCYVLLRGPYQAAWFAYVKPGHSLPRFMQGREGMDVVAKTWLHVHQTIEDAVEYVADNNLKIPKQLADAPVKYCQAQMQLAFMLAGVRQLHKQQVATDKAHARHARQIDVAATQHLLNKALAEARKHKSPMQLMPIVRKHNKKSRKMAYSNRAVVSPQKVTLMPARMRCDVTLANDEHVPRLEREWQRRAQRQRRAEKRNA